MNLGDWIAEQRYMLAIVIYVYYRGGDYKDHLQYIRAIAKGECENWEYDEISKRINALGIGGRVGEVVIRQAARKLLKQLPKA